VVLALIGNFVDDGNSKTVHDIVIGYPSDSLRQTVRKLLCRPDYDNIQSKTGYYRSQRYVMTSMKTVAFRSATFF